MKVITNEQIIKKRKKLASILSPLAMALLLIGLTLNILSLRSEEILPFYFYGTLIFLMMGFAASTISSGMVNRWVKEPRADQTLQETLKGFDNKHILFNYTTKTPHVLITPTRVLAITAKHQGGEIKVTNNKWRRGFSWGRLLRFFADEGLGNPTLEAKANAERIENLIQKELPPESRPPVEPIIIFNHPQVELTVEDPEVPVMKSNKLKKYVRDITKGSTFSAETRQTLVDLFSPEEE